MDPLLLQKKLFYLSPIMAQPNFSKNYGVPDPSKWKNWLKVSVQFGSRPEEVTEVISGRMELKTYLVVAEVMTGYESHWPAQADLL